MTTQLEQLLRRAVVALNDWTQTYAEEFCDPENVEQAKKRIKESGGTIAYIADLVSDINAFLAQPEQADRFEDFPVNDWNEPIIYDTNEIDQITHALTGDEGEQDSVTVLHSLVGYLNIVHPGKTMTQVLIETEEACGTVQRVPTSDTSQERVDETAKQRHEQPAQDGGACPTCGAWHDDQIVKQPAQDKPVAFCKVEDVYDNDSLLAQLGVKRGDILYTRPQAREPLTWQSIETAPRDSKARLVWCPDRQNTYAATRYKDKWCIFGGGVLHEVPTHWMPLPTPPIEATRGIGEKK